MNRRTFNITIDKVVVHCVCDCKELTLDEMVEQVVILTVKDAVKRAEGEANERR